MCTISKCTQSIFKTSGCLCVDVSDLQDASYLSVFVKYRAACSLFEAGLQLSNVLKACMESLNVLKFDHES